MAEPMTEPMTESPLREMNTGEVIREAFRLYRQHFAALVLIALVPHVALLALDTVLGGAEIDRGLGLGLLLAVTVVLNALVLAAMTHALGGAVVGRMPGLVEAYRGGFGHRVLSIVAAYLVIWMLVTLGFLAFILPGLVIGGLFVPAIPIIVLEKRNPLQALGRSYRMMRPVLAKGTAVFAFVIVVSGLLPLLFHLIVGPGPYSPLLSAIAGAVTLPLAYTASVVLYLSLRSLEGYTPEQLEAELTG